MVINMVDRKKVLHELGEWSADPIDAPMCMKIINLIENERPFGRIIMRLLRFAENGNFK